MTYLLGANVFETAKDAHCGFDFVPGFWEWIEANHDTGKLRSINKVGQQLLLGKDELAMWANIPEDEFKPRAVSEFLQSADYYLVAHEAAERYETASKNTGRLPPPRRSVLEPVRHAQD